MLLPLSLFAVVQAFLVVTEAQSLSLDTVVNLNTGTVPNPPTFSIPTSQSILYVSAALCANSEDPPRFFITNDTSRSQPGPSDVNNVNVFELSFRSDGFATWSGAFTNGGVLSVLKGSTTTSFEILVSATNSTLDSDHPLLGDTTSNQALLFSPPFAPPLIREPTYPNYTLPPASLTFPPQPSAPPFFSLVFAPTSAASTFRSVPRTTCAIRAALQSNSAAVTVLDRTRSQGMWLRDNDGWRWQWLIQGLTANTNYTVFALQDGQLSASRFINILTKSASFNCPIVHSLPFCPGTSYAVPLAAPRAPATSHTASTIPFDIGDAITSTIANFTVTLTTLACGRDNYSPLVTCADCQTAYRTWLCAISFPRCSEPPVDLSVSDSSGAQVPFPALQPVKAGATPRNPVLPPFNTDYTTLLPCLETCNAADRACPAFLGFKCPLPRFTAANSYGVGFVDSGKEGQLGRGSTGDAQDLYGNVWCNAG